MLCDCSLYSMLANWNFWDKFEESKGTTGNGTCYHILIIQKPIKIEWHYFYTFGFVTKMMLATLLATQGKKLKNW